jgi:opacity protein-like surface antigen
VRRALAGSAVAAALLLVSVPSARSSDYEVSLDGGYFIFTQASNSAKAVLGSSGGATFGVDGRVGVSNRFSVGVGIRFFKKDGEKAFVAASGSPVFPLTGEPLSLRLIPIEATLFYSFGRTAGLQPYIGIGPGFALYHEDSTVGGLTSSLDESKFQAHAVAGVEFGRGATRFGVELNYSTVPNAVGIGGVSQVYNEKDIGGLAILGRIVFGTAHR